MWIGSSIIYNLFKKMKIASRTREKRIPDEIINSSNNIVVSYIKGLIDGDGHLDRYGDIVVATRSSVLSKQLVNVLLMLGVQPSVTINGEDITIRIGKSSSRTPPDIYRYLTGLKDVSSFKPALNTEPTYGIPIDNKLKKLLISLANEKLQSFKSTQRTISKPKLERVKALVGNLPSDYEFFVDSDITLVRVKSVKHVEYEGYVYDFAVPKYNNFAGGYGIIYHNSDPYGWYIYSVFKIGSITLSYESERLATPTARFLGVAMSDVFGDEVVRRDYKVFSKVLGARVVKKLVWGKKPYLNEEERRNYIIKATKKDLERAAELIGTDLANKFAKSTIKKVVKGKEKGKKEHEGYPWFKTPRWILEIGIFYRTEAKLEIEAIASKSVRFLAEEYIPSKIEGGDWIE